jgi:hypothetical protein
MFDVLTDTGDRLAGVLDILDPDRVTGSRARQLWAGFDRIERLAAAGKTLLARRVAATHSPTKSKHRSAVDELARHAGSSTKAARDTIDTSTRLTELPEVDEALRRGQLSPAQAELITDAAAATPTEQRRLVGLAEHATLPELRDECLRVKASADPDPEATHRRIHQRRYLRRYTDAEGGWNLHARGTPDQGAIVNTVLDPIINHLFGAARREGRHEPVEAYAFDALLTMAERAHSHDPAPHPSQQHTGESAEAQPAETDHRAAADPAPSDTVAADEQTATDNQQNRANTTGGIPAPAADTPVNGHSPNTPAPNTPAGGAPAPNGHAREGRPPNGRSRSRPNPRYLALLRIDVEALRRGYVHGQELCEITGVGPVPVTVARDLLGDAIIKLVITNGVDVCNITHLGRGPTAAQRAALLWTSPTCCVEGCYRTRIEFDHRDPWADTHHTRLDELDPLCKFHHDQKTHRGYALTPGTGKRPLVPPNDPRHPTQQKANTTGHAAQPP